MLDPQRLSPGPQVTPQSISQTFIHLHVSLRPRLTQDLPLSPEHESSSITYLLPYSRPYPFLKLHFTVNVLGVQSTQHCLINVTRWCSLCPYLPLHSTNTY